MINKLDRPSNSACITDIVTTTIWISGTRLVQLTSPSIRIRFPFCPEEAKRMGG